MIPPRSTALSLAVFLAPVCLAACGPGTPAPAGAQAPPAPREVHTARVERVPWAREIGATGELRPFERVVPATKVPGRLAELLVDRGSLVRSGELIATLEAREYELRVEQAAAAVAAARAVLGLAPDGDGDALVVEEAAAVKLAQAELDLARLDSQRAEALAKGGVDSQSASDRAEAALHGAESRLQEARELVETRRATLVQRRAELGLAQAQLAETRIVAPFAGVVVERRAATGSFLAIGAGLCELVRIDPLRLVLEVGERDEGAVRLGQDVRARLVGGGDELAGRVTRLAPDLAPDTRTLVFEVELPNPGGALRPGAFVEARVVVEPEARALAVPLAALSSFAGLEKVYVVQDGKALERRVAVGRRTAERVELVSGVAEGEEVVLEPGKLSTGTPLRVLP